MSEMRLTIIDSEQAITGRLHGSVVQRVFAGLAADPATIDDLRRSFGRYAAIPENADPFAGFQPLVSDRPYDAGVMIVEMPARLVVCESSYFVPAWDGRVEFHNGREATRYPIPFSLSHDWQILDELSNWWHVAAERRMERATIPSLEVRDLFYDRLAETLLAAVWKYHDAVPAPSASIQHGSSARHERTSDREWLGPDPAWFTEVHADWLLTPQAELSGRTPREIFLSRRDHILCDVENQAARWSYLREAPPGVARDSWAYRAGGMGAHEFVVHYDLVRALLAECSDRLRQILNAATRDKQLEHLRQFQQEWLHQPREEYGELTPAQVIDRERQRLPCVDTEPAGHLFDDCPVCQMLRQGNFGPAFWFLDGSHMDDHFAFSPYTSREEWLTDRESYQVLTDSIDEESKESGPADAASHPSLPRVEPAGDIDELLPPTATSVWERSFVSPRIFEAGADMATPSMQLVGVGMHLAEVISDLRESDGNGPLIEKLMSSFGDVQQALTGTLRWLLAENVETIRDLLRECADQHPTLVAKCECLRGEFDQLLETLHDGDCGVRPDGS